MARGMQRGKGMAKGKNVRGASSTLDRNIDAFLRSLDDLKSLGRKMGEARRGRAGRSRSGKSKG